MSQKAFASAGVVLGFLVTPLATALACEISVRDAAFQAPREVHRLSIMADSGDESADAMMQGLASWLEGPGRGLNLEVVRVNADDPNVPWADYAIPSSPPALPVVVLVGRNHGTGENFVIDHWEPGPSADDLALLRTSPARDEIQQQLGQRLGVVIYAPATSGQGAGEHVLEQSIKRWSERSELGLSTVQFDRSDPRERVLVSFLGLDPEGPDWVGVVFGRGKLMVPPLEGKDITLEALDGLIEQLGQNCSCSKPLPAMGVDLPLIWHDDLDARVLLERGPSQAETGEFAERVVLSGLGSFVETRSEDGLNSAEARFRKAAEKNAGSKSGLLVTTTLWTACTGVFVVMVISVGLLRRVRH